jgi:hypothetical protein
LILAAVVAVMALRTFDIQLIEHASQGHRNHGSGTLCGHSKAWEYPDASPREERGLIHPALRSNFVTQITFEGIDGRNIRLADTTTCPLGDQCR